MRGRMDVAPGIERSSSIRAGHLLGSAFVMVRLLGGRPVGSLRWRPWPLIADPCCRIREPKPAADVVLMESTYGDRGEHLVDHDGAELAAVIKDSRGRGGKVVIPAFAIGRVEELLYWVRRLEREKRIPDPACLRR